MKKYVSHVVIIVFPFKLNQPSNQLESEGINGTVLLLPVMMGTAGRRVAGRLIIDWHRVLVISAFIYSAAPLPTYLPVLSPFTTIW